MVRKHTLNDFIFEVYRRLLTQHKVNVDKHSLVLRILILLVVDVMYYKHQAYYVNWACRILLIFCLLCQPWDGREPCHLPAMGMNFECIILSEINQMEMNKYCKITCTWNLKNSTSFKRRVECWLLPGPGRGRGCRNWGYFVKGSKLATRRWVYSGDLMLSIVITIHNTVLSMKIL